MGYADVFPQLMAGVSQADLTLARGLRDWGENELAGKRLELQEDYEGLLKPAMRKLFCDIGMQKILWPERLDGGGQATPDLALTMAVALEEIGRVDTGIACLLAVNYALGGAVAMAASPPEALAEKLARDYCQSGEVVIGSLVLPALGGKATGSLGDYRGKTVPLAKPEGEGWLVDAAGPAPLELRGRRRLLLRPLLHRQRRLAPAAAGAGRRRRPDAGEALPQDRPGGQPQRRHKLQNVNIPPPRWYCGARPPGGACSPGFAWG